MGIINLKYRFPTLRNDWHLLAPPACCAGPATACWRTAFGVSGLPGILHPATYWQGVRRLEWLSQLVVVPIILTSVKLYQRKYHPPGTLQIV